MLLNYVKFYIILWGEFMEDLYKEMGFTDNPFSRFSAEEELEYLKNIYVKPRYYNTIYRDIRDGASRFIIGERGIGKSALMFNLKKDFGDKIFTIIIDEYGGIKVKDNQKEILLCTMEKMVTQLGVSLIKNKEVIRSFEKSDKEKLTFFINTFFKTLSKDEFEKLYDTTTKFKLKSKFAWVFNSFLLKPTNIFLSGVSEWFGSTVSRALGLPPVTENFYKTYIPELIIKKVDKKEDILRLESFRIKELFYILVELIIKCNYENIVIFYDKIDEYQSLGINITNIAEFIKSIATDTNILQTPKCSFVLVIWSKVKDSLNSMGVRFDKFKPIDITWTDNELKKIIDKRLLHFSNNQLRLESILPNPTYITQLIQLAYKSPRHLIILLSRIYDEQEIIDSNVKQFSVDAIEKGMIVYAKSFDFPSLYPGEKGKKAYIVNVINRMLKVGKMEFKSSDLVSVFKVSTQSANNDIKIMREYGLIQEVDNEGSQGKRYCITEPRIKYLTNIGIKRLDLQE